MVSFICSRALKAWAVGELSTRLVEVACLHRSFIKLTKVVAFSSRERFLVYSLLVLFWLDCSLKALRIFLSLLRLINVVDLGGLVDFSLPILKKITLWPQFLSDLFSAVFRTLRNSKELMFVKRRSIFLFSQVGLCWWDQSR